MDFAVDEKMPYASPFGEIILLLGHVIAHTRDNGATVVRLGVEPC
jgi:hypothetical protein